MASPYTSCVNTSQVGSYFVGQYYPVLQQRAGFVHQFYNDASTMIFIDGDSTHTASAIVQIDELLTSLNFTGIEIKKINSLDSWNGGILVMVSGSVKVRDYIGRRNFVQTFFLAPQEKGYFVLNDIFQFMDEETIPHHPETTIQFENNSESHVFPRNSVSDLEPPVSDYVLVSEEKTIDYFNSVHIQDDTVDKYSLPDHEQLQDNENETVIEESPLEEPLIQSVVNTVQNQWVDTVDEPVGVPQKKTYASILQVAKGQPVSSVLAQPYFTKRNSLAPEWHHTPEPTTQQSNTAVSHLHDSIDSVDGSSVLEEEGEFKSVYVRNLPPTISASDIEQEFKHFGKIQPDGVFLRLREEIGVCYAFVEFEDVLGVQTALQSSPIQLFGRQVFIEERKLNSNSSFRGGRRGRGRGTYRGSGGSGRGSNQYVGGDYDRTKGNGFYQRKGY